MQVKTKRYTPRSTATYTYRKIRLAKASDVGQGYLRKYCLLEIAITQPKLTSLTC